MSIRAKFLVSSVSRSVQSDGAFANTKVEMHPVTGRLGEANAEWAKYTPSGQITLQITQEGASDQFLPGQEYYVAFTLAEKE